MNYLLRYYFTQRKPALNFGPDSKRAHTKYFVSFQCWLGTVWDFPASYFEYKVLKYLCFISFTPYVAHMWNRNTAKSRNGIWSLLYMCTWDTGMGSISIIRKSTMQHIANTQDDHQHVWKLAIKTRGILQLKVTIDLMCYENRHQKLHTLSVVWSAFDGLQEGVLGNSSLFEDFHIWRLIIKIQSLCWWER